MDVSSINSDLIRGNVTTVILKSLCKEDRYGYDILREIEEKSEGQYKIKQPTLYSCLKRLEKQGLIESYWGDKSDTEGGRRKYYKLTQSGYDYIKQMQSEYVYSRTILDKLLTEQEFDFEEDDAPFDINGLRPYTKRKPSKKTTANLNSKKAVEGKADGKVIDDDLEKIKNQNTVNNIKSNQSALSDKEIKDNKAKDNALENDLADNNPINAKLTNEIDNLTEPKSNKEKPNVEIEKNSNLDKIENKNSVVNEKNFSVIENKDIKTINNNNDFTVNSNEFNKLTLENIESELENINSEAEKEVIPSGKTSRTIEDILSIIDNKIESSKTKNQNSAEFNNFNNIDNKPITETTFNGVIDAEIQNKTLLNNYETKKVVNFENGNIIKPQVNTKNIVNDTNHDEACKALGIGKYNDSDVDLSKWEIFDPEILGDENNQKSNSENKNEIKVENKKADTIISEKPKKSKSKKKKSKNDKKYEQLDFYPLADEKEAKNARDNFSFKNDKNTYNYLDIFSDLRKATFDDKETSNDAPTEEAENKFTQQPASNIDLKTKLYSAGYKIRPYSRENTENYYSLNFLHSNKINRDCYGIMYLILVLEVFIGWLIFKSAISPFAYLTVALVGILIPAIPFIIYSIYPNKRIRANFNFKTSILNRLMLFLNSVVVVCLIGFFGFGAKINDFDTILKPILLPIILLLNIPLSSVIYYLLYKTKKYHVS